MQMMMLRAPIALLLCLLAAGCGTARAIGQHGTMIVRVPLADLRAEPGTTAQPGTHDANQETQLLYGEIVKVVKQDQGWANVEAVEQPEWSHANRWQGYPGWVKSEDLLPVNNLMAPNIMVIEPWAPTYFDAFTRSPSPHRYPMGARLHAIDMGGELWRIEPFEGGTVWMPGKFARGMDELAALPAKDRRPLILDAAKRLIGQAYYWGGRSAKAPGAAHSVLGVDCSGLTNLAYRVAGVNIPRDAHEQFLRAKRVTALEPADLIFLSAQDDPDRIVHVMLYAGNGAVIEGPGTGMAVRAISLRDRLGRGLDRLAPGDVIDGQTVSFGSYLAE